MRSSCRRLFQSVCLKTQQFFAVFLMFALVIGLSFVPCLGNRAYAFGTGADAVTGDADDAGVAGDVVVVGTTGDTDDVDIVGDDDANVSDDADLTGDATNLDADALDADLQETASGINTEASVQTLSTSTSSNVGDLSINTSTSTSTLSTSTSASTQIMYRMYNPYSGEHLYTAAKSEKNSLKKKGWLYEGVGWLAPTKSSTPVYRMYNKYSGDHHYTMSKTERDKLKKLGWKYEGIGWYSDDNKAVALYRQYNPYETVGTHNYTTSKSENDSLKKQGWKTEGIAWYATAEGYVDKESKALNELFSRSYSGDVTLDRYINIILYTQGTDLRTLYNYVSSYQYINGSKSHPSGNWTVSYAKAMYENGGGTCYNFAALFCWLAKAIGYEASAMVGYVPSSSSGWAPHGWVELKQSGATYVCDPDLQHELSAYNCYMVTYANAPVTYKK